jgi:nicotinate phosphoribosyltransferase
VTLEDDPQDGEALLRPVMRSGQPVEPLPTLGESRFRAAEQLACLPERLRALDAAALDATPYPVRIAAAVHALAASVDGQEGRRRSV